MGAGTAGIMKKPRRRFVSQAEYVDSFKSRGETVPPFLVFQPYVVRDSVEGYMVPCRPDHPDAEEWR